MADVPLEIVEELPEDLDVFNRRGDEVEQPRLSDDERQPRRSEEEEPQPRRSEEEEEPQPRPSDEEEQQIVLSFDEMLLGWDVFSKIKSFSFAPIFKVYWFKLNIIINWLIPIN